jgi:hypothetical protein
LCVNERWMILLQHCLLRKIYSWSLSSFEWETIKIHCLSKTKQYSLVLIFYFLKHVYVMINRPCGDHLHWISSTIISYSYQFMRILIPIACTRFLLWSTHFKAQKKQTKKKDALTYICLKIFRLFGLHFSLITTIVSSCVLYFCNICLQTVFLLLELLRMKYLIIRQNAFFKSSWSSVREEN